MPNIRSGQISDKAAASGVASLDGSTKIPQAQQTNGPTRIIYVDKAVGNDSNDGSFFRPFLTIQAGINAANLLADGHNPVAVEIRPQTSSGYTENLTLSQQGVILRSGTPGFTPGSLLVFGTLTVNLTGTSGSGFGAPANQVWVQGITFQPTANNNAITFSGSVWQRLYLMGCYAIASGTGSALVMTNGALLGGSTKSTLTGYDTWYENNSATIPTVLQSAGALYISGANPTVQNDNAAGPSFKIDGAVASGSYTQLGVATIVGTINISDNTSNMFMAASTLNTGSQTGIVTPGTLGPGAVSIGFSSITTTANPAISGFGVLALSQGNAWGSTGNTIDANVTQFLFQSLPSSSNVTSDGVPNASTVAGAFVTQALNTLEVHVVSTANPHAVTAAQAGAVAASGLAKITVSTSAPISPAVGDVWIDTN